MHYNHYRFKKKGSFESWQHWTNSCLLLSLSWAELQTSKQICKSLRRVSSSNRGLGNIQMGAFPSKPFGSNLLTKQLMLFNLTVHQICQLLSPYIRIHAIQAKQSNHDVCKDLHTWKDPFLKLSILFPNTALPDFWLNADQTPCPRAKISCAIAL